MKGLDTGSRSEIPIINFALVSFRMPLSCSVSFPEQSSLMSTAFPAGTHISNNDWVTKQGPRILTEHLFIDEKQGYSGVVETQARDRVE